MFIVRALSGLMGLAVLASRIACLLVIAWFVVFAVGQSKAAASHQVAELAGTQQAPVRRPVKQSGARKTLDTVASALTAPFSGLTSGRGAWFVHGVDTLLVLLVYGFGFGFLVRLVRVRV
jgi:hypothetical protein